MVGVSIVNQNETGGTVSLSTDSVFETLSNRRRRYVLHYLKTVGGTVTVRDLSEQLAAWENEVERAQVTSKDRKRLYTALHQTHLPKMQKLRVVKYDRDRGTVTATTSLTEFDLYFESHEGGGFPWSRWYLLLSGLFLGAIAAALLGVAPFTLLDGFEYALAGSVTFLVVALSHVLSDWRRTNKSTLTPPEVGNTPTRKLSGVEADDD